MNRTKYEKKKLHIEQPEEHKKDNQHQNHWKLIYYLNLYPKDNFWHEVAAT